MTYEPMKRLDLILREVTPGMDHITVLRLMRDGPFEEAWNVVSAVFDSPLYDDDARVDVGIALLENLFAKFPDDALAALVDPSPELVDAISVVETSDFRADVEARLDQLNDGRDS